MWWIWCCCSLWLGAFAVHIQHSDRLPQMDIHVAEDNVRSELTHKRIDSQRRHSDPDTQMLDSHRQEELLLGVLTARQQRRQRNFTSATTSEDDPRGIQNELIEMLGESE